ncbi:amino acid transporter [Rhodococcus sp. 06-470-2]|uniref:APC family permease n=1 Tax=unclassified Rhodococcus (in: high G+C Gram-positive bacteria) TaxID=192944 RepID=UPI000B9B527F|nr:MULTISPECIES: APC family permease [unclassified Rhodococcus (in: high G+C Gram-positive bacteria)]OZC56470.1 amino acid transporter [Rhodococcus sp. 06-470-2]OZE53989.1 amino acid transporter [Rhodococcus sp. 05-2221-1B]OZF40020.1 amino acid transporter [Rhodococcus sp. 14-2496-1d]
MSALEHAIARSFSAGEPAQPALSPLRALGRRQLSGVEVLAQSIATTAPAASMVVLPIAMLTNDTMLGGVLTIAAATIVVSLIAFCISQFTRRLAASGGLYSFTFHGARARAALTVGTAMLVKYCASGALTLYSGGQAVMTVLDQFHIDARGGIPTITIYLLIAASILACLLRGVRFAATAILVVEVCSLVFILVLLMIPDGAGRAVDVETAESSHGLLLVALAAMFSLAGFESAAFFAPEARRPLVNVTRTVMLTPIICGTLFTFAAWAVWSGRGSTLIEAYLHGSSTGIDPSLVIAVNVGLSCSWLASSMASSNAASRLVYTLGIERVIPRIFGSVHRRFRTPSVALVCVVVGFASASILFSVVSEGPLIDNVKLAARAALIVGYVLVAVAAVLFLRRIGELETPVVVAAALASGCGVGVLMLLLFTDGITDNLVLISVFSVIALSGTIWASWLRTRSPLGLRSIGVFDSAETTDVLPGSASYGENSRGAVALVKQPRRER